MKRKVQFNFFVVMALTFLMLLAYSCEKENVDNKTITVPIISTSAIDSITLTTARCGGNITSDGGSSVIERGVCWSTTENPTIAMNKTVNGAGVGIFTSKISGLTAGNTYYVRAYATNYVGTGYGKNIAFNVAMLPIVTTTAAHNILGSTAEASGSIISDGGSTFINFGICWSESPNPSLANAHNISFDQPLIGLTPNTNYYFRAYATNSAGTAYGNQLSFNSGYLAGTSIFGGLVFYNDGNAHGLVCAAFDQVVKTAKWGCEDNFIGGTSSAINKGAANTNAIVAGCGKSDIAARVCFDLNLNSYNDWYLPSIDELNLMHENLNLKGMGNFPSFSTDYNPDYWSSTEKDKKYAWAFDFLNGYPSTDYKDSSLFFFNVRAVRSF